MVTTNSKSGWERSLHSVSIEEQILRDISVCSFLKWGDDAPCHADSHVLLGVKSLELKIAM